LGSLKENWNVIPIPYIIDHHNLMGIHVQQIGNSLGQFMFH